MGPRNMAVPIRYLGAKLSVSKLFGLEPGDQANGAPVLDLWCVSVQK